MKSKLRFTSLLMLILCSAFATTESRAQEPSLSDVLASTPQRANAILYFDAPSVREFTKGTPLSDDLSEKLGEVRIAAELDFKTIEPSWEIGYVSVANLPDAAWLAKAIGGYADAIAGKDVIWSPKNAYLIPSGSNVLGIVRPADRKLAGLWIKKEHNVGTASYLQKQATQGTKFISVLLAFDLEDVWSPIAIEQRIATLESLKGTDLKSISKTLSTVKGLRVIASRKNLDECIISLDFGASPAALLPVANAFFAEALTRINSSIPEASKWTASVDGNTLAFRGTITPATLDDMLGIFTLQRQASGMDASNKEDVNTTSDSAKLAATKDYFAKTAGIIKRVRDYSAGNTGERAQWNGRMANRIDELPTLNVDPELVEFGAKVAQGLRGNAVALQQTNIANSTNAMINAGTYGYSSDGYYYNSNAPYQYRANARGLGFSAYKELISAIDQLEGDIRRRMTEKYQVQF